MAKHYELRKQKDKNIPDFKECVDYCSNLLEPIIGVDIRTVIFPTDDNYEKSLKIASKKFDLTGIRIYDIKETEIPKIGIVPIIDAESGKLEWVDTNSKKVRHNYKTNYDRNIKQFHSLFKKNGAGIIDCRVDESYVKKLLGYFKRR